MLPHSKNVQLAVAVDPRHVTGVKATDRVLHKNLNVAYSVAVEKM